MNTRIKLLLAVFAVTSISYSCNRMEEQVIVPGDEHHFSVSAELPAIEQEAGDTKGYLGSFIGANWSEGDKLSVVNLTTGKILGSQLTADRAGNRATFIGTVKGTINQADKVVLVYPPFDNIEETEFSSLTYDLAAHSQTGNVPLVAYSDFIADNQSGDFEALDITFYYVLSYLKINLANLPAGESVSKVSLKNVPTQLTMTINDTNDGFVIATEEEKSAKGKIDLDCSYTISASGTMALSMGVMPSSASNVRSVVVTIDGVGDYLSPMASAELRSHKYYNTIASRFEKISLAGESDYGIYDVDASAVIDKYEEFNSTVITGVENGENDFTLLNTVSPGYWTLKGIPSDAIEGTSFTARVFTYFSNGAFPAVSTYENAVVRNSEQDGDFTKLWIKAGNILFIVRK